MLKMRRIRRTCAEAGAIASMVLDGETQNQKIFMLMVMAMLWSHPVVLAVRRPWNFSFCLIPYFHICGAQAYATLSNGSIVTVFFLAWKTFKQIKKRTTKQGEQQAARFEVSIKNHVLTWFFVLCLLFIDRKQRTDGVDKKYVTE